MRLGAATKWFGIERVEKIRDEQVSEMTTERERGDYRELESERK